MLFTAWNEAVTTESLIWYEHNRNIRKTNTFYLATVYLFHF